MSKSWILPFFVAAMAALLVAALGATLTNLGPWYQSLAKPGWTPPDYMFPMAWTVILALAALAAVQAWSAAPNARSSETVIGLFALNGFLNIFWSMLFFSMQRPDLAFYEVIALWFSILVLIGYCMRIRPLAGILLVPYIAWVSVAGALNWEVVALNPAFG
jgi:tryptophan-rich sensory protein